MPAPGLRLLQHSRRARKKDAGPFPAGVDAFAQQLRYNEAFRKMLTGHRWLIAPEVHVEEILENPQYLSSLIIFLREVGTEVPKRALRILALPEKQIPVLDLEWLEILLDNVLYGDEESFQKHEALLKDLRKQLLPIGAIERRHVKLRNPSDHTKLLTTSVTKLKSIEDIVRLEAGALGDDLRCVVLTDFIRKSEMPKSTDEPLVFEDIGIVPIFETLRRAAWAGVKLGVLTRIACHRSHRDCVSGQGNCTPNGGSRTRFVLDRTDYTFSELTRSVHFIRSWRVLLVLVGIATIVSLPWAMLAVWRFLRHGTPERSLKQIAHVVLESLVNAGVLQADLNEFRIYADRNAGGGSVYCWLGGGSGKDQTTFLRALREVMSPLDNPRYLLSRTKLWRFFREDYFAVPEELGRKKEFAEFFARKWKRSLGNVELVYTRRPDGRQILLRARIHSLSAVFQKKSERVSCWK